MNALSLGPIPTLETIRLTISLPAQVKADLDRYAQLHEKAWGMKTDAAALIPHIVETFLARDKEFQKQSKLVADEHPER